MSIGQVIQLDTVAESVRRLEGAETVVPEAAPASESSIDVTSAAAQESSASEPAAAT